MKNKTKSNEMPKPNFIPPPKHVTLIRRRSFIEDIAAACTNHGYEIETLSKKIRPDSNMVIYSVDFTKEANNENDNR